MAIAAFLLAFIGWRRSKRVDDLEERMRALESELRHLRAAAPAPPAAAPPAAVESEAAAAESVEQGVVDVEVAPKETPVVPPPVRSVAEEVIRARGEDDEARSLPPIDWERWLGVRGAAVLGGVVLALAAIFFFRYSIEHGLIPPWLRVVAGTLTGVACIAASERLLRERYGGTADALAGAGIVILYASSWAARVLYELIGTPMAFVLMIAITVAGCVLSWSHASLVIALLGLIGGFATPLLLATGVDNPIGLFAYVFLLDGGLLYLARRQRWPLLALCSLAATTLYQATWILLRMEGERAGIGLAILGVSSLLFAVASRDAGAGGRAWMVTQGGGVLLPLGFVAYMAARVSLSPALVPLFLLVGVVCAAACWLAAVERRPWLGLAAASAAVAITGAWVASHALSTATAWQLAAAAVLVAAVFHAAVELERAPSGLDGPAPAAMIAAFGLFWVLIVFAPQQRVSLWPFLAGWLGLAAILARHAAFPNRAWLQAGAAGALALGLVNAFGFTPPPASWSVAVAVALAAQAVALLRRDSVVRAWANHAAAFYAGILLLGLPRTATMVAGIAPLGLVAALVLGICIALAAARTGRGEWLLAAVVLTAWCQSSCVISLPTAETEANAVLLFALVAGAVILFALFPFAIGGRFRADRFAWPAAAVAGPSWFIALHDLFELAFGDAWIGLLPIGLGAVAAVQGWLARDVWPQGEPARPRNLVWFFVVAIGFLTLAIPLQLRKEWITIAWALEGFGVLLLWRRFDVPWLKYFALALLAGVTVRLIVNPAVLGYYPRPAWRIVNWLLYTYLAPAAALFGAASILQRLEVGRAREWESFLYRRLADGEATAERPLTAIIVGFAGVVVVFVWINLAIVDWFSSGATLRVSLDRLPARDLAMSICWALYALALLAGGVRLRSVGARWVSLGLMIITIAKVFLYDLGELRDLYRVASLLGLAMSLIAVSLAYQRFVLKPAGKDA